MMTWDFFFRLLVAGVLGAIIGLDRDTGRRRRDLGLIFWWP